jgi:glycosyltransferase involved in cell wall biosynthesis
LIQAARDVRRHATVPAKGKRRGELLLSYILEPFVTQRVREWDYHTNSWESAAIASTFADLGFDVDVIYYRNRTFVPRKSYDVFIDSRHNMERLHSRFPDAIKIQHLDTTSMLFHNLGETRRLYELQMRRGVTLQPRRVEFPNRGLEFAHCGTVIGNAFTAGTWEWAKKPIYKLPLPSRVTFEFPETKRFDNVRQRFLWLGTGGAVHKGLDLVLEAFAQLPHLQLTICGPVENEPDFVAAYHRELFETSNISVKGWVDVTSAEFRRLCEDAVAIVYASCAEAQAGSVVTAMHAGLIPIVSVETGVDVEPFGVELKTSTIPEIIAGVEFIAGLSAADLEERGRATWTAARASMTRDRYLETYKSVAVDVLERSWK